MSTADHPGGFLPVRAAAAAAPAGGAAALPWDDLPPEAAPAAARALTARLVARTIRRHWGLMLLIWGIGSAALVALAYTHVQPSYDATAWLEVKPPPKEIFGGSLAPGDNQMETQVQLITSPDVLSAAAKDPKVGTLPRIRLAPDAELELRRALRVQIIPRTTLINVYMSSPSPEEAARIVNAVVEAYDRTARLWTDGRAQDQIREFQQLKTSIQLEVAEKQDALRRLFARSGGLDLLMGAPEPGRGPEERSAALDLDKLRSRITPEEVRRRGEELLQIDRELFEARAVAARLRAAAPAAGRAAPPSDAQVEQAVLADPEVAAAAAQYRRADEQARAAALRILQPGDPSRLAAQRQCDAAAARYRQLRRDREPAVRRGLLRAPADDPDQKALRAAEQETAQLADRKAYLEQTLRTLRLESKAAGTEALEIQFAQLDFNRGQAKLDMVTRTLDQLDYEVKHGQARITIISKARPTAQPTTDHRLRLMAAAPLGMLAAVLGAFVLLEARAGRVADPDDLPMRARLGVLAVIPPLPSAQEARGLWGRDPVRLRAHVDQFVQSLDHLRVALFAGRETGAGPRVVMITSACGGEGKTTLAAHLAGRCANAGLRTLLIDADLRRPRLATLLGVTAGLGLADVLAGAVDLEAALIPVGNPASDGFLLLPAGAAGHDPSRLLQGGFPGQILARLRADLDLDVILLDTPPVLAVPDALLLGRWADGAVLAVRRDASRLPLVEQAHHRLLLIGVPVLGAVVNGVRAAAGYGYGYGYSSDPGDVASAVPSAESRAE